MTTLLSERTPRARKDYLCMACLWIDDLHAKEFNFSERRDLVMARRNGWKIKKGDKYVYQALVCCGDFYAFRAIPAIHALCIEYDLYENC